MRAVIDGIRGPHRLVRPVVGLAGFARALVCALTAWPLFASAQAVAPAEDDRGCVLQYRVTPRYDREPRAFEVELSFPAQGRGSTELRLASGWAGVTDYGAAFGAWQADSPGTSIAAGDAPNRWQVSHPPEGRVRVHATVRSSRDDGSGPRPEADQAMYRAQVARDSFQFFGYALLPGIGPWRDDTSTVSCLTVDDPTHPEAMLFGSHGTGQGRLGMRLEGSPGPLLRHAFFAGGPGWRLLERPVPGGTVRVALRGRHPAPDAAYADAAAALIGTHRRFWGAEGSQDQWLVITPNFSPSNRGGTVVHGATVLHVDTGFSPATGGLDFLVGHENLHQWFSQRFGGRLGAEPGHGDLDSWFSEGFTDYYTHRLLLASGQWTLQRYATELTTVLRRYWRSPARQATAASLAPRFFSDRDAGQQFYRRGELLAMRWDRALRQGGGPGLDEVLRNLMLPTPADPRSTPAASERVLDGLGRWLGALPRRDLQAYFLDGRPLPLDPDLAGPCFDLGWDTVPRFSPGFDTAASFKDRRLQGVVPGGPAAAAGLRDGQALLGWSVYGGDVTKDIELTLPGADGAPPRVVRYRPVDGSERLPTLRVVDGADTRADCRAWQRRDRLQVPGVVSVEAEPQGARR
jgi:predicted metalloprotease with PDZ domain